MRLLFKVMGEGKGHVESQIYGGWLTYLQPLRRVLGEMARPTETVDSRFHCEQLKNSAAGK